MCSGWLISYMKKDSCHIKWACVTGNNIHHMQYPYNKNSQVGTHKIRIQKCLLA